LLCFSADVLHERPSCSLNIFLGAAAQHLPIFAQNTSHRRARQFQVIACSTCCSSCLSRRAAVFTAERIRLCAPHSPFPTAQFSAFKAILGPQRAQFAHAGPCDYRSPRQPSPFSQGTTTRRGAVWRQYERITCEHPWSCSHALFQACTLHPAQLPPPGPVLALSAPRCTWHPLSGAARPAAVSRAVPGVCFAVYELE
jgi:hypothetical protein